MLVGWLGRFINDLGQQKVSDLSIEVPSFLGV